MYDDARLPMKAKSDSAGYDIFSYETKIIKGSGRTVIGTGITFKCPENHFGHILSRSGLAVHNAIQVGAGVIDRDYEGELCNSKNCIAQIVIQTIMESSCSNILQQTSRGSSGFGSTDDYKINSVHSSVGKDVDYDDLILLDSPYDKKLKLKIRDRGLHKTRGLERNC